MNCHRLLIPDDEYKSSLVQFTNGVIRIPEGNILEILEADDRFNIILNWLTVANLAHFVGTAEPLTFFVPSDEAFSDVPDYTLANIKSHSDTLKGKLLYMRS